MNSRQPAALALGALLLTALAACTSAPGPGPGSAASAPPLPGEEPAESPSPPVAVRTLTSPEVQSGWWGWAVSVETELSPVLDTTGRRCAEHQREGIWYLAGTTGGEVVERTCTVPVGLPLLFPLVTTFGEASDCQDFMDTAKGSATLDGAPLAAEPLGATRIQLNGTPGNPFGERIGNTWSCGLWVRLDPLTPGDHELTIRGESAAFDFSTGVDYHLRVAVPTPTGAV
ncbi:signal protein [Kitasatospora sp. NPDC097605]|uniref:signal protein n=1 Tax=Kitasatospora sp. NPDC097605 TaxID=3157226 RepID=UPI003318D17D